MSLKLFPREHIVGAFRGFQSGGLEFHADLALPYRNDFQNIPMHGQFILVQLESEDEAVLGRITAFSSEGKLSHGAGEEYNLRAVSENREIPEDLREQYLKYRVNIRVLGVVRVNKDKLTFVPSQRRLPHVGSPVAFPSPKVLQEIAGHNEDGSVIGHLALGEFIYADAHKMTQQDWMQFKQPEVQVKFPINSLVARRSFIFARAGFGKSNLNKLLFSRLYASTPTVTKRGVQQVPVGTIIFDPDGEYFWPDDKGRPGLCDVPDLHDKLVVFTARQSSSKFYQSFVAGGIKLDIRSLSPADVISIALSPERQEQQNVRKLKSMNSTDWRALVDLIAQAGNGADPSVISKLLKLDEGQSVEALAARSNMTQIVHTLHDRSSQMMDKLLKALSDGKLCVIDTSQLRGGPALVLSGIILKKIFDHNQAEFTKAQPRSIPTIAVVEEAQSVLNEKASGSGPYIDWVKEGRKYDLGALLITQQPGSIPDEILSQGDNFFIFHLLSAGDLTSIRKANAHFSEDILSVLLNEPIPGHCVFWSSVAGRPYPVSLRTLSFEEQYQLCDPDYSQSAVDTYASRLNSEFNETLTNMQREVAAENGVDQLAPVDGGYNNVWSEQEEGKPDIYALQEKIALKAVQSRSDLMTKLKQPQGARWGYVFNVIKDGLAEQNISNVEEKANQLVVTVLRKLFGEQDKAWRSFKDSGTTFVTSVMVSEPKEL